jgi:hypothetical protein
MFAILYSQPVPDAIPTITHDSGAVLEGFKSFDIANNPCLKVEIPEGLSNGHGCTIEWYHPDFVIEPQHCLLITHDGKSWWLMHDVWKLAPRVNTPEPPDPIIVPGDNPLDIITYVYESSLPNLSTHNGCGKFCEDVQTALSNSLSALYGHILKDPAQNQYNGHAVDAVMLLMPFDGVEAGVYDIIQNSVSAEATPAFNYVEPPIPHLWYNPAFESIKLVARRK